MASQTPDSFQIFFALLRSGMYGTPIPSAELPGNINWESVVRLAKMHAVYGIIIDSVQFLPPQLQPSGALQADMNKFALGLIQANLVLEQAAGRLVAFFRKHGLDGVLLKGQGVARYYRVPQMRHSGDIDFYVGRKNYNRAVELCRQHLIDNKSRCGETEHHFTFYMSGVPIEIHRMATRVYSPLRNSRFQRWIVDQLEHSSARRTVVMGNTDITLPSYDFDVIFIFYHAWRHYLMGGIGIRQLCDWALIFHTHGNEINIEALKDNIHRFGMIKGWKLFACIVVRYLGVPLSKMPLYDPSYSKKSEEIFQEIIAGGSFGHYSKANTRTPMLGYGLIHGLGKVRNITEYFLSLFPIIPVEATFLYFNRLYYGTKASIKRSRDKSRRES